MFQYVHPLPIFTLQLASGLMVFISGLSQLHTGTADGKHISVDSKWMAKWKRANLLSRKNTVAILTVW